MQKQESFRTMWSCSGLQVLAASLASKTSFPQQSHPSAVVRAKSSIPFTRSPPSRVLWGFKYKSIGFQWLKLNKSGKGYFFGLGRWTRGNTEPCLLAVKGKPSRKNNGVSQLIEWPIGAHSEKPPITRDKIKTLLGASSPILRSSGSLSFRQAVIYKCGVMGQWPYNNISRVSCTA